MGLDLRIVRGRDFTDNPAHQISSEEWLRYVSSDPELTLAPEESPYLAVWSGPPKNPGLWIEWYGGYISAKNSDNDSAIVAKMLQIAHRLSAEVRDLEGIYTSPTDYHHD